MFYLRVAFDMVWFIRHPLEPQSSDVRVVRINFS
jgi:hypothetical protein